MSFLDDLFGGKKADPTVTQTSQVQLGPEQQQIFNAAFPFIQQYANSGLPTLPTNTVAGFNPNQIGAQNAALSAAGGNVADLGNAATATNKFLMDPRLLSPDTNPWLAQQGEAIARQMTDNLNENVLPGLRSGATSAGGMYSGGATKEGIQLGLASGKNSLAIGDALKNLYGNAYNTGLGAMSGALGQVGATQNAALTPATVMGQVGSQQQIQAQTELDAQNQLAQLTQMLPFLKSQDLLSLIGAMPGAKTVGTATGATPPSGGGLMGGLGGAASGAALGSMLLPGVGALPGAAIGGLLGFLH